MYRIFALVLTAFLITLSLTQAQAASHFERLNIADPQGQPLEIGIWSPDGETAGLPLVVMSHGTGGDFRSHIDTAQALAEAGFVAAAVTHSGDNWRDLSGTTRIWERPRHLKVLTDYMLGQWPGRARIDAGRIGAFGFSAGGFTVLVAAGGVPDLARIPPHCRAHPAFFECALLAASQKAGAVPSVQWTHDHRIKAAIVAAPALGYTFSSAGLKGVGIPIQLWRASEDEILPHPFYAEAVRAALPTTPDYRIAPNAGHFDFLSPCAPAIAALRPEICNSRSGFDRKAFHVDFNRAAVAFFLKHLPAGRGAE